MADQPCAVAGCPALGEPQLCAVHRAWQIAVVKLKCARCKKAIRTGSWYHYVQSQPQHPVCQPPTQDDRRQGRT